MRGFWRTLAYIAENQTGFGDAIDAKSGFVPADADLDDDVRPAHPDPKTANAFFLARQPTKDFLVAIDGVLRGRDSTLRLTAYELGEVNRISYIGKTTAHNKLRNYWNALGAVATANRDHPGFMEAVGALAIDIRLRDDLRVGPVLQGMFDVTTNQENGLRAALPDNGTAEQAAVEYFDLAWPTGQCLTTSRPWETQMHPNI